MPTAAAGDLKRRSDRLRHRHTHTGRTTDPLTSDGGDFGVLSQMGMNSVAEKVSRMASEFYRLRNISMIDLLRSSGYVQNPSAVMEQDLEEVFRAEPELIDAWVRLSENKRTRYPWLLVRGSSPDSGCIVMYPNGRRHRRFPDACKACAFFVKQEIEGYRANV